MLMKRIIKVRRGLVCPLGQTNFFVVNNAEA